MWSFVWSGGTGQRIASAGVFSDEATSLAGGGRPWGGCCVARGREISMRFGDFLKALESGDENLYLTTQDLVVGLDDRPSIISPPVSQLLGDFPLRPSLLPALVPQNMNLWMGRTQEGSSSGLHHDYHDNLCESPAGYDDRVIVACTLWNDLQADILLRGRKRFRLFSPADAER
jgi:hypothetical protein